MTQGAEVNWIPKHSKCSAGTVFSFLSLPKDRKNATCTAQWVCS